ncbi:nucleotide sugar dehydrogenase [Thiofaba sp. EF100]|jgi:UDP-N-acetyl-D-galactosamine dehydrogenase|uniref:nucleotide sugar dehydrogenase n=1 Tax=Thiofaba sp. EF100 TaxID=3121274 RepID=UPI003221A632
MTFDEQGAHIAVIGMGYVGLPLAVAFARHWPTLGFDANKTRIEELQHGYDRTGETTEATLKTSPGLRFSADTSELASATVYVIAVPTPVNLARQPDFEPLLSASETVGRVLKPGDVVIYESTVYPGATEEICVPVLEQVSGLAFNVDFYVGYSPERINPGDGSHSLENTVKVTSGSTPETADFIDRLYRRIVKAGTFRAESLRVAEAAKVIENTQRDVNIALINELAMLFHRLGMDTRAVLEAAASKWNFLPFQPGLVGGHCIGVDPYYLTYKAQMVGHHPDVILAGRRINDDMGRYVGERVIKLMAQHRVPLADARVLILGLTFKENCPDIRNTRVVDIIQDLQEYGISVDVHDPLALPDEARQMYGLALTNEPAEGCYAAVVLAVAHEYYRECGAAWVRARLQEGGVVFDVKGLLPRDAVDGRL